jgi:hypothetical protein
MHIFIDKNASFQKNKKWNSSRWSGNKDFIENIVMFVVGCHNMTALHCITGMVGTIRFNSVMKHVETRLIASLQVPKIIYNE